MRRAVVRAVVGVVLLVGALALGWAAIHTGPAADGELGIDQALSLHRTEALTDLSFVVDEVDGPRIAPVLLVVAVAILGVLRRWADAAIGLLVTGFGWVSAALPKLIMPRARPGAEVAPLYVELKADSFTSGHVAFVAAATMALCLLLHRHRFAWWPAALVGGLLTVGVAVMRLYSGVHWAADVIAAPIFAAGTTLVLWPAYRWAAGVAERVLPARRRAASVPA